MFLKFTQCDLLEKRCSYSFGSFILYASLTEPSNTVLPFCFSSPCQRPLSAVHPAWPQLVPTVYRDCHQAHGGLNKGGSVPFVLSRIDNAPLAQTELKAGGLLDEHGGGGRGFDLTNLTARVRKLENGTMRKMEKEVKKRVPCYEQYLFKATCGHWIQVLQCHSLALKGPLRANRFTE